MRPYTLAVPLVLMLGMLAYTSLSSPEKISSRRLMDDSCPAMESWEDGFWGAALHVFVMFYIFCSLAIICDDYFCESLEKISDELGLSPDVAGATFMAAGSSAPELFVSFADNVIATETKSIGVGTIIGSAIFNILIIIALTAALAGQDLQLDFRPLARDSIWYTISIVIMVIVIADGEVHTGESIFLVLGYVGYVTFMVFNESIMSRMCPAKAEEEKDVELGTTSKAKGMSMDLESIEVEGVSAPAPAPAASDKKEGASSDKDDDDNEDPGPYFECLTWASVAEEGWDSKAWFIFAYPINVVFRFTVPDCNHKRFSGPAGYVTCFVMSIIHIAVASHFLVDSATKFGCIVHMPFALMGLTIVAAGTSVPDAISSVVVAKSGEGDMAVSNAIGSNVFDILLGLGLPYLLSNTVKDKVPTVSVDELIPSVCILFGILTAVIGILWWSNWMLNPKVGMSLFVLYFLYVVFAYIHGLS
ncbi:hypothetical protein TL16_g04053 [Triparma laevis f. inornata]|uniref:Sodium/calcium exchanger membrane region domain-containing protein n=1 Tax=Triparma laevis f. inornata TaxID=1714386 RepID=A0A9W7E6X5_9STRA|nr:hypothetical protein TL16_g04053 [Triparma laevis f. inornata]